MIVNVRIRVRVLGSESLSHEKKRKLTGSSFKCHVLHGPNAQRGVPTGRYDGTPVGTHLHMTHTVLVTDQCLDRFGRHRIPRNNLLVLVRCEHETSTLTETETGHRFLHQRIVLIRRQRLIRSHIKQATRLILTTRSDQQAIGEESNRVDI